MGRGSQVTVKKAKRHHSSQVCLNVRPRKDTDPSQDHAATRLVKIQILYCKRICAFVASYFNAQAN